MTVWSYADSGFTNGTTVATGEAGVGNPWDVVSIGGSAALTHDNTHLISGTSATTSIKASTGATSTTADAGWNSTTITTSPTTVGMRICFYFTATGTATIIGRGLSTTATQKFRVLITSGGLVQISDSTNAAAVVTTGTITTGQFQRIEISVTAGATGACSVSLFTNATDTVAAETKSGSGNFVAGAFDQLIYGIGAAGTNLGPYWIGYLQGNDTGAAFGPPTTTTAKSDSDTGTGTDAGESLAVTITDSDTGTGTDAGESLAVTLSSADTGGGTDAGELIGVPISSSDTGTFTDGGESIVATAGAGALILDQFIPGYTATIKMYFGADPSLSPSLWTATDVTSDLLQADGTQGIVITRGRPDEQSTTPPAMCQYTLRNETGNYTVRRPQSKHWPYVRLGIPVEILVSFGGTDYERFSGFVDDLTPSFDETGNYTVQIVTAHGVTQRLGQGADALPSPMTGSLRSIANLTAWWPLEDIAGSSEADSGLSGGLPMRVANGSPVFGSIECPPGAASAVTLTGGGSLIGKPAAIALGTSWRMEVSTMITLGATTSAVIMQSATLGDIAVLELDTTAGQFSLQYQATGGGSGSSSFSAAAYDDGLWHRLRLDVAISGSNTNITFSVDAVSVITWTLSSLLVGSVRQVTLNPNGPADPSNPAMTQLVLWEQVLDSVDTLAAQNAYNGEDCISRMTRLCAENNVIFAADGTSTRLMGAQPPDTLLTNLRDCEAVNGGVLEDGVGFGLYMHTSEAKGNLTVAMTATLQQLDPPFNPVENNLLTRNDVTVSRPGGGSARFIQPTGLPYAATGAGGIGTIGDSESLNVFDDSTLPNRAAWFVHLGTIDADRYPGLGINLAHQTGLLLSWLACGVGSRIQATGNYSTGGVNGLDVLIEGWTETISKVVYQVSGLNVSPVDTWRTFIVQNSTRGRVGGAGTTLHTGISSSATSLLADAPAPWTTTAQFPSDFPFDINLNGEQVTVGAITGTFSPITFSSLTRSVNGVSKTHTAGAPIDIWRPAPVGL